jgi:hypothetical protein
MKSTDLSYSSEDWKRLQLSEHLPLLNTKYLGELAEDDTIQKMQSFIAEKKYQLIPYPKFKNVEPEQLINLRISLHFNKDLEILEHWSNKLLRYFEINQATLKKKEGPRKQQDSIALFQQVKALFVEYYINKGDLIYLNTALKILDQSWLAPTKNSEEGVKALNVIKNRQIEGIIKELSGG